MRGLEVRPISLYFHCAQLWLPGSVAAPERSPEMLAWRGFRYINNHQHVELTPSLAHPFPACTASQALLTLYDWAFGLCGSQYAGTK